MIQKLTDSETEIALAELPGWQLHETRSAITKSFKFRNFSTAWAFMNNVATLAEKMNHHPEWSNTYNKVDMLLTTHEAGGITVRDTAMAKEINNLAKEKPSI